jgi:hypothetical protein
MFTTLEDIESFIREFETHRLPKTLWTHEAHLVVGLWYLTHHSPEEALDIVRDRIRAYNEATGTQNTDTSGYHETVTRWFLHGIATGLPAQPDEPLPTVVGRLLQSPLADKNWPLSYYTRERLLSVEARRSWIEPNLGTLSPVN